ncbi:MAG: hypothetical protein EXR75_00750 [Myxococcales bacterium]|nr:hypothetical protein [Myxococcales bacterium]
MTLEIRSIDGGRKVRRDFLNVVDSIYATDPAFVRSLDMDISDRLDRKKNPFFEHGEATAFVAYLDQVPVGRISASIDRLHTERHCDGAGFFGFFDTIDDARVAEALLDAAAEWLRQKGAERMRGPFSLSINEECGCLVSGFESPPMIMMPHHRPHQGALIEAAGLTKSKDLFAWRYEVGSVPRRAQKAFDEITNLPEIEAREVDLKHLERDVELIMGVFNDAWSDNWGFLPATPREVQKMAADLSMIALPQLTQLVFINGEVAAVALALPNVNEMIHDAKGQLFPTGALKLWWRLRVRGPKSARLIVLGITKKWRHARRYAGLSAYLYVKLNQSAHMLGIRSGELGWTLEDNAPINVAIKMMGGHVHKTYRIYERPLV